MAVDTSSLRGYLTGASGSDVDAIADSMYARRAVLPPAVITELLSYPFLSDHELLSILSLPILSVAEGYWHRAGSLRAAILRAGSKCNLADTLIAQVCIDAAVPLITFDRDFRHFVPFGLELA